MCELSKNVKAGGLEGYGACGELITLTRDGGRGGYLRDEKG